MYDLLIYNAKICDGSGEPAFAGAVAVADGRIVAVGDVTGDAREKVDAHGLVIAPGFIDQHTHYDAQLVWDGLCDPAIEHGVTTIMPGNCALSLAPLKEEHRDYLGETFRKIEEMPKTALDAGLTWNWQTFDEYIAEIKKDLGINVAPIVGHSLLRLWVMGLDARKRKATDAEVAEMQALLRQCLAAGAVAMSTSWVDIDADNRPVPCRLAEPAELDALCAVLGEHGAALQVVPEFYDTDMLAVRIDILADLSRKHGITATFSPLFDSTVNPDLVTRALERVRLQTAFGARVVPQMQVRAIDIAFELMNPGSIMAALPNWWKMSAAGPEEIKRQLNDPEIRKLRVQEALDYTPTGHLDINFHEATVKRVNLPEHQALIGRKLKDIAAERGTTSIDVMIDIALAEDLDASFGMEGMGHNQADKIGGFLADKHISIGAGDGGAHLARFATYGDTGYLFSRYVRRSNGIPLEEAVRKLTSDIAKHWGLKDRGLIRVGYAADLVLFDETTIDRGPEYAEYDLPGGEGFRYMRRAEGVKKVWVNGQLTYDADTGYTGARAGEIAAGGAPHIRSAPAGAPAPLRSWTYPQAGDDWPRLAGRTLPDLPVDEAIQQLQSWNLYLAFRVAPAEITPTDILFTEAPAA
jgi:N-acyl-D-aspartate/D-glutamate deacylase